MYILIISLTENCDKYITVLRVYINLTRNVNVTLKKQKEEEREREN